jgi:hypothetical protein
MHDQILDPSAMFPIRIRWASFSTSLDASDAGNLFKGDFWM